MLRFSGTAVNRGSKLRSGSSDTVGLVELENGGMSGTALLVVGNEGGGEKAFDEVLGESWVGYANWRASSASCCM